MVRPATKKRPERPKRRPATRGGRPPRRRLPWYRRHEGRTFLIVAGIVVAGAIGLVATRQGRPDQSSPSVPVVGPDLHSLVVDPAAPVRLWIGSHQGASVSTDGGRTWRVEPSLDGADAMGWAFVGDTILVGGHPGISVSTDGGQSFEQRNEGLPATDVHALGAGESVIYAASPAAGVFASTDGGSTWEMRTAEVGQAFMGRILVDPADEDHLLAPDMQAGAAESTDGGRSWTALGGVQGA
ncbi:MAG: WD40/YVTN/BNR-like repeat-containing protein, partial [Actinomycetota bacterium]